MPKFLLKKIEKELNDLFTICFLLVYLKELFNIREQ